ncbi:MAG: hypothetical protein KJ600_05120 [Nanoarchaeota archaeon]|nr:hypothetical protein [Nanoarchaeota archaeon]MBU1103912.1 hypothetical protein [Nanoarchaeota archaeon]
MPSCIYGHKKIKERKRVNLLSNKPPALYFIFQRRYFLCSKGSNPSTSKTTVYYNESIYQSLFTRRERKKDADLEDPKERRTREGEGRAVILIVG